MLITNTSLESTGEQRRTTIVTSSRGLSRFIPLRFIHFKCQFDVFWPVVSTKSSSLPSSSTTSVVMAPLNLQPVGAAANGFRRRSQEDFTDCTSREGKSLTDFNWQKTMIQSRIMEKVHNVGDKISSQSWLEQMRLLAKERSFTSVVMLSFIGLVSLPILVCVLALAFTFFGFIFVEGTLLTIGCCLLGGLLVVVACLALPFMLILFITYTLSSTAFNFFSNTGSKIRHMVVPTIISDESPQKFSANRSSSSTPGKSCTDGTAFLPACITESDSFLEATVLRRAQMNNKKLVDDERF